MVFSGSAVHRPFVSFQASRARQARLVIVRLTSNDIKNGTTLEIDNAPWRVMEFLHVKPGKGAAFVRSKIKNLRTGNTVEKTFRAGEPLTAADVNKQQCQFTYTEGETFVFMDMESYEEVRLPRDDEWAQYLPEGTNCDLLFFNGEVISVEPPQNMDLKVTQSDPAVKGNTAQGATKPATLETGAIVQVPLFIQEGDTVKVDTREGKYLSKA
eukprot:jgi/Ulvmu1/713/UM010_0085.1